MRRRVVRFGIAGVAVGLALVGLPALQAAAANFDVTNTNDSGPGSLRQAIIDASAAGGVDTVVIPSGLGTITVSSTIHFTGADLTTVQGNGNTVSYPGSMPFNSNGTTPYTLDGLTINGDQAANTLNGALTITNSTLNVDRLGANTSDGALTITGTTINSGDDGANTSGGAITLTDSTINAVAGTGTGLNTSSGPISITMSEIAVGSSGSGYGVNTSDGAISITDSQIMGGEIGVNSSTGGIAVLRSSILGDATDSEVGINSYRGMVSVINSTVTGFVDNGIYSLYVTLVYASVVNNGSDDGEGGTANIVANELTTFGSVVTAAFDDCDIGDVTVSNGYNYSNDATCGLTSTGDVQNGGDPGLGALADNGGPGLTLMPLSSSPLLNAIPLADCQDDGAAGITTDERSLPRPAETGCEIGAVEVQTVPPSTTTTAPGSTTTTAAGTNNAATAVGATPRFVG